MPVSVKATPGMMTACTTRLDHQATPSAASAPAAGEDGGFGHRLRNQPRRRFGTERDAGIAMSRCMPDAAREQQVGDVRAGDQQDDGADAGEPQ